MFHFAHGIQKVARSAMKPSHVWPRVTGTCRQRRTPQKSADPCGMKGTVESLRDALVAWYRRSARDLPWRRQCSAYGTWVSEVMLQQTQVATVVPYYLRFMDAFPTATALANAPEDQVLAHWSGLGYYRRARLLHAGAQQVVAQHGGEVPAALADRRSLPGIGRYTAGAIGSIAFGLPEAVVDGNVARVLSRIHGIAAPLASKESDTQLWQEAEALHAAEGKRKDADPGALNQGLMELGARICTPKAPSCAACPIQHHCFAFANDQVASLPVPKKRKLPKTVAATAVCAWNADGRVWLLRGEARLFGGLWTPPMVPFTGPDAAAQALAEGGLQGTLSTRPVAEVSHTLTHRHYRVTVYRADDAVRSSGAGQSFDEASLADVGVSRLTRKLLAAASAP